MPVKNLMYIASGVDYYKGSPTIKNRILNINLPVLSVSNIIFGIKRMIIPLCLISEQLSIEGIIYLVTKG